MTDEEIICEWMEKFDGPGTWHVSVAEGYWSPTADLTLDRLHEVEERLAGKQWDRYRAWFTRLTVPPPPVTSAEYFRMVSNADAAQKIKALAAVLREAAAPAESGKES